MAVIPTITTAMTAVFAFQFAGWVYHPPAGDQTCLGYLNCILAGEDDWNIQRLMGERTVSFLPKNALSQRLLTAQPWLKDPGPCFDD